MGGFFYQLGKIAGPKVRKAKWIFRSLTGTEAEVIQAEYEAGRDLARTMAGELEVDDDLGVRQLVEQLGRSLTSRVKNESRRFVFQSLKSAETNAFALPGGFIWVTRPLVELCGRAPDELAFILGHEMGHVVRKHAMDRMLTSSVLDAALRTAPIGGLVRSKVGGIVRGLLEQGYSQDQELEADLFGVRIARSAGYEPAAATQLLARLGKRAGEPPGVDKYFSSHPPFELRIRRIREFLKS